MNFLDVIMPPHWQEQRTEVAENIGNDSTGTTVMYIVIAAAALLLCLFVARKYRKSNK